MFGSIHAMLMWEITNINVYVLHIHTWSTYAAAYTVSRTSHSWSLFLQSWKVFAFAQNKSGQFGSTSPEGQGGDSGSLKHQTLLRPLTQADPKQGLLDEIAPSAGLDKGNCTHFEILYYPWAKRCAACTLQRFCENSHYKRSTTKQAFLLCFFSTKVERMVR